MTKFQQRVLTALRYEEDVLGTTTGPCHTRASVAHHLAVALDSSEGAVTRALRALEGQGWAERVHVPGLSVDGWTPRP